MRGGEMRCECGKEISEERDRDNEKIAQESKTPKLHMCDDCWWRFCEHAITGN